MLVDKQVEKEAGVISKRVENAKVGFERREKERISKLSGEGEEMTKTLLPIQDGVVCEKVQRG